MTRTFTSGNYLKATSPADIGGVGTIFFRFKPTFSSGDSALHSQFGYNSTSGNNMLLYFHFTDNNMYVGWYAGSDSRITVSDSGFFASGVWANHLYDWDDSADLQHVYVDNTLKGTSSTPFTVFGSHAALVVGAAPAVGFIALNEGDYPGDGDIAEWARWDRVLTADERAILHSTGCPLHVPRGLVRYYPIIGRNSPEIGLTGGGENLAVTGTPAAAPHPRIFLPYGPTEYFGAATLTHYTLTADVGTFTETGQAANLLYGRKLTSDVGTFALAGQAASLLYARLLAADVGAFTLAGQAAGLLKGKTLTADVGTFALTGQDVAFRKGYALTASTGVFTESGQAADLRTTKILSAAHGSFTLSGQDATLTAAGVVTIPSGRLFRVSRETRIFRVPPQ